MYSELEYDGKDVKPYPLSIGGAHILDRNLTHGRGAIDLLLISNGETKHYCWIRIKVSRLFSSHVSNHKFAVTFCDICINHFPNYSALETHQEYCSGHKAVRIEFPIENILKVKNHNRSMRVPFVLIADFECHTNKISTCSSDESKSFMVQVHVLSLGYLS